MRRDPTYCASCRYFPLAQAEETGKANCEWQGDRGWNFPACVLHDPASDREARKAIVIRLMKKGESPQ